MKRGRRGGHSGASSGDRGSKSRGRGMIIIGGSCLREGSNERKTTPTTGQNARGVNRVTSFER